jgi:hypothetical protein
MAHLMAGCLKQAGKDDRLSTVQRQQLSDSYAYQAVDWFRDALAKTNLTIKQIQDDPKLARLRENSAFQTYLAEITAGKGGYPNAK